MLNRLFDGAVEQLTRGLAFAARRHEVLAQNAANLETPGYRGRDLVFDDQLRAALEPAPGTENDHLQPVGDARRRPRVVYASDTAPKPNGNDVDLDHQMTRLAENTLYHQALVQVLAGQFQALKQAISGRV
jgi:flagellar basal-body rod protein FlgB